MVENNGIEKNNDGRFFSIVVLYSYELEFFKQKKSEIYTSPRQNQIILQFDELLTA